MSSKVGLLLACIYVVAASLAPAQTVTITSPVHQSTVTSPVRVQATAASLNKVRLMQVFVDGTKAYETKSSAVDTILAMQAGGHGVTVRARDIRNRWFESSVSITVAAPLTPLAITTTSLPSAVLGTSYNAGLAASGGTPAYTWGLASGTLPPGLLLAATTGSISGTPASSGAYSFTARVTDSAVPTQTTTRALSITVATTPPASGGPLPGPNDVIIFQDDFETGTLNQWDETASQYAIESDPASVHGGAFSMRGTISAGYNYGPLNKWFMPGYDEVYVRFQVMFSPGFVDSGMHLFALNGNRIDNKWSASGRAGIRPNGSDFFATTIDPEYPSQHNQVQGLYPLQFYSYWPEMACPASYDPVSNHNCYGNVMVQTAPKVENTAGVWHEVVVRMKMNSVGQHDGLQELWIDSTKKISQTGMRWRDTTDLRLNQFAVQMYVEQAVQMQHIWVDDVVVWRPGPDARPGSTHPGGFL